MTNLRSSRSLALPAPSPSSMGSTSLLMSAPMYAPVNAHHSRIDRSPLVHTSYTNVVVSTLQKLYAARSHLCSHFLQEYHEHKCPLLIMTI